MDTSSTTQLAQMGKHRRSRGTSGTKFVWSSISCIAMGKKIRRSFIGTWVRESTQLGMHVRSSETKVVLVSICGCIKMAGKKQNMIPCGEEKSKMWTLTNPHHILTSILGCTQREGKPNETITEQCQKMFESRISVRATEKLPGWEKPHAQTVAWSFDMEGHAQKKV